MYIIKVSKVMPNPVSTRTITFKKSNQLEHIDMHRLLFQISQAQSFSKSCQYRNSYYMYTHVITKIPYIGKLSLL